MILTGNYGLKKPEGSDPVDKQDFNDNADIIDEELSKCVVKGSDSAENTVTFNSGDAADSAANPLAWSEVALLASGERHSSILNKVSSMFRNVRYLYKLLGTTDIAGIGGGTVTGAISAQNSGLASLNADLKRITSGFATNGAKFTVGVVGYFIKNGVCYVSMEVTPASNVQKDDIVCSGLPLPYYVTYLGLTGTSGVYTAMLDANGRLQIYYPVFVEQQRVDCTFCYLVR